LRIHYRSAVVENMTALLNTWWSPRFQRDIVADRLRGLSTIDIRALWTLGSLGPLRSSDLAAALAAGAPSVSKCVARLDAAGLVTREPNPVDQRAHTLHLTAAGREAAQQVYDVGDAMVGEIFADWDEADVEQLSSLLARFVAESQTFAKKIQRD
jgi:DNA-binding MarR family transcriptional regulator